ncbi:hypothetical protein SLA2020_061040 [Shorea laevis]
MATSIGVLTIFHGGTFERGLPIDYVNNAKSIFDVYEDKVNLEEIIKLVHALGYQDIGAKSIYFKSPLAKFEKLKSILHANCVAEIGKIITTSGEVEVYIDHNDMGPNSVEKLVGDAHRVGEVYNGSTNGVDIGNITHDIFENLDQGEKSVTTNEYSRHFEEEHSNHEEGDESNVDEEYMASPVGSDREDEEYVTVCNEVKLLQMRTTIVNGDKKSCEKEPINDQNGSEEQGEIQNLTSVQAIAEKERLRKERAAATSRRYKTLNIANIPIRGEASSSFTNHVLESQVLVDNNQYANSDASDEDETKRQGQNSDGPGWLYSDT